MVCVRPVRKGQEVFNTYGQMANWQLLHMYGFAEPPSSNGHDTADVPAANLYQVAAQGEGQVCQRPHWTTQLARLTDGPEIFRVPTVVENLGGKKKQIMEFSQITQSENFTDKIFIDFFCPVFQCRKRIETLSVENQNIALH